MEEYNPFSRKKKTEKLYSYVPALDMSQLWGSDDDEEDDSAFKIPPKLMSIVTTREGLIQIRFSKEVDYIDDWYRLMKDPNFKIDPKKFVSLAFVHPDSDESSQIQDKESPIEGIQLKSLEPSQMTLKVKFKNPEYISMGSSTDRDALQFFFPGKDLAPVLCKEYGLPVMVDNSLGDMESIPPS